MPEFQKEASVEENTSLNSAEKQEKEILQKSKISLILNSYDDLFSDFDPRAYTDRALSQDFLYEAKNAARDKNPDLVQLMFLVPRHLRNPGAELVIKHRLHEHFKKHNLETRKEMNKIRRKGVLFGIAGILIGAIATILSVTLENEILRSAIIIVLEPASWFSIWNGFDHIFLIPGTKKAEHDFYEKMVHSSITFQGY